MKLWTNGTDTYVAESAEQARELWMRDSGDPDLDGYHIEEWWERTDGTITITLEDGASHATKTREEWIAFVGKPGMLCSTEY